MANQLDLPGMVISARRAATDDAEFATYAVAVRRALEAYDARHDEASDKCRAAIQAAITTFGVERNEVQLRRELAQIYDHMQQDNNSNAVRFNFELATALGALRERADVQPKKDDLP